jgi:hypothetical protein
MAAVQENFAGIDFDEIKVSILPKTYEQLFGTEVFI